MNRSLQTRLLNYFLLIALAAIMIGIEFYFEMSRAGLQAEICGLAEPSSEGVIEADPLDRLRNKIVIMFGVLTLVVAIVLMMFIQNITTPLQKMAAIAQRINAGDLSQMVEVEGKDEIGQVGTTINDLTSNLQEVAAFTSTTSEDILGKLEQVAQRLQQQGISPPEELLQAQRDLQAMRGFVGSFTFFN